MDRLLSMRVFQRVADEGSFAGAARALDLSPAAVTRLVADLEAHLRVRLLNRSTRRLALTDAGQGYLQRVRAILEDIEQAEASASSQAGDLAGTLRVHAPPVLATYILAPVLAGFRERYPGIVLEVDVGSPGEPPVEEHDLTLLGGSVAPAADTVVRPIVESEAILVASPAYLRRHGAPRTPQELADHALLRLRVPGQRVRWMRLSHGDEAVDVEVRPAVVANHSDTLLRAALDGAGITSAAVDLVAEALTDGDLVRVLAPWTSGRLTLFAAMPSRKFTPQRTRVFLDYLVEQTRALSERALATCAGADNVSDRRVA